MEQGSALVGAEVDERQEAASALGAGWATRAIYCLALLALVFSSAGQVKSWMGLAMGRGLVAMAGPALFFILAAAIAYRIYDVVRYPDALAARPPDLLGGLLRGLGCVVMLAGVVGLVAMFLVEPLTWALFKDPGDGGIRFFVVGVYAATLAGVGWVGCVLFEISRLIGERVPLSAGRSARQRMEDYVVLGTLAVLATAVPLGLTLLNGTPCHGPTLGRCAAKVEGGVFRMVSAPVGAPVVLESNIDEIEYRHPAGRAWELRESPALSLLKSGHTIAQGAGSAIKVSVTATPAGRGATVVLTVSEQGVPTARFTTRFDSHARMEPSHGGKHRLVVELARNTERPLLTNGDGFLDELYQQMRLAIGSEREVAEAASRVQAAGVLVGTAAVPEASKVSDARPAQNCDGVVKLGRGNAERDFVPSAGSYLAEATFLVPGENPPTVLLHLNDRVSCQDGAVWLASLQLPGRTLHIRKYDLAARLERNLLVSLPPRSQGQSEVIDETSFAERAGRVEFALVVQDGKSRRLERFSVKL